MKSRGVITFITRKRLVTCSPISLLLRMSKRTFGDWWSTLLCSCFSVISLTLWRNFLDLCQGNVVKRQESRWEELSSVSIVIHVFTRLLARAIYSRAILDSYESDALCVSILLSTDIWCKQFVFFSNNFAGNVFSELAQPSRKSSRSRLNAWRVVTAYCTRGSQTRRSKAFLSVTSDFLLHFPSISLKILIAMKCVYIQSTWKINWIKQRAPIKEFLFLSRFFTERQESSLSSPLRFKDSRHPCG